MSLIKGNHAGLGGSGAPGGPLGSFYSHTIDQSLRYNSADTLAMKRTPSSAGNRQTWSVSVWVKRSKLGVSQQQLLEAGSSGGYASRLFWYFDSNDKLVLSSGDANYGGGDRVLRDVSSWYHILIRCTGGSVTHFVNGVLDKTQSLSGDTAINSTVQHGFGTRGASGAGDEFDGYLAQYALFDGTAYTYDQVTETKDGILIPKNLSSLSYGANGFLLDFADSSDVGNNANSTDGTNDMDTVSGFVASDVVPDSPTNNFATFNVLEKHSAAVLSEGSLVATSANANDWECIGSTMHVSSGKWYCEVLMTGATGTLDLIMGVARSQSFEFRTGNTFYTPASNFGYYASVGDIYSGGSLTGDFNITYGVGDIIGIAIDMDNLAVYFAKNNTYINSGNPASGASKTGLSGALLAGASYQVAVGAYQNNVKFTVNFGQDSSFAGVGTAQNNADGNGIGDFYYSPPSGFLALCSSNLPDPAIGPTADTLSTGNFDIQLWTGTGSGQAFSNFSFQPDFLWFKQRNGSANHALFDVIRGVNAGLSSYLLDNENTAASGSQDLVSFDNDGFTTGTPSQYGSLGSNTNTIVTWAWKAGGSASSNSNGSVNSQVSANADAGFSIVTYTGGSAAYTVGHGLSKAPEIIFVFNRTDDGGAHYGFTTGVDGSVDYFSLNAPGGFNNDFTSMSAPTNTVFGDDNDYAHDASDNMVAYCFHSVEGYSKVGSYTGNGNADGTFVYTGFRPAFVLTKTITASSAWRINDAARNPFNGVDANLYPSTSAQEDTGTVRMDFLSNGFKLRVGGGSHPNASTTYLYLAFAESPFKFANAR